MIFIKKIEKIFQIMIKSLKVINSLLVIISILVFSIQNSNANEENL